MKLFSKCLALATALGLLTGFSSCSADEPGASGGGNASGTDGIYSTLRLSFPATRSTESEGIEVGQVYENNIGSILVVVAQKTETPEKYTFLSFALNDAPLTGAETNTYTVTFQDKETLFEHANQEVYIFAYCNPTQAIRDKIAGTLGTDGKYTGGLKVGDEFTDEIFGGKTGQDPYDTWKQNGFLMTNVEIVSKQLPDEETLKACNTPARALTLGTIPVMRTMCRFDFRDASKNQDLTYEIPDPNDDKKVQGKVKLTSVAMFNLADRFYYLPRIGNMTSTKLCPGFDKMEVTGNDFVISAPGRSYTEAYPTADIDPSNRTTDLKWLSIGALLGLDEDNDTGWGDKVDPATDKLGYHIWRYATENTFSAGEKNTKDNTTGYVFEAEILPNDNFGNVADDGTYLVMYLYNGILYANAKAIYDAKQKTPISTLATAFDAAFTVTTDNSGAVTAVTPKSDELVKAMGFTAYKPTKDNKYFCYYFAYNTHNDNGNPTEIGNMEFATVRNNVYKLAVTNILKFGTLTPPEEVEEWDTYFTLDVRVMPWVVRINNIEFK